MKTWSSKTVGLIARQNWTKMVQEYVHFETARRGDEQLKHGLADFQFSS